MLKQQALTATQRAEATHARSRLGSWTIALTSLFFILLQSACAAFMAISGLRLLLGVGALAAATAGFKVLVFVHSDALRLSMEAVAVAGSAVNLFAIRRVRSLRAKPSAQWRLGPVDPRQRRSESIQIALAVLTLALVAMEWVLHLHLHDRI